MLLSVLTGFNFKVSNFLQLSVCYFCCCYDFLCLKAATYLMIMATVKWFAPKKQHQIAHFRQFYIICTWSQRPRSMHYDVSCFIMFYGPGLIPQCYSEDNLWGKKSMKNVITGFWHQKVAYCSFKTSPSCGCLCLLMHTTARKPEEINFRSPALFCVASEILLEGIIVVFHTLALAVGTHLEKYMQCCAEKSIQQS